MYRLLPSLVEQTPLRLDDASLAALVDWQIHGEARPTPDRVRAQWYEANGARAADFPSGYPGAPVLGPRLLPALAEAIPSAGALVPVEIDGTEAHGYHLFRVDAVVDCVDTARSTVRYASTGELERTVLRPEVIPTELPAFRVPQFPTAVHWNAWAALRLRDLIGDDLELRLVWSADPGQRPHPSPWGF
ncbi:hypothetical protein RM844_22340 [Streptomyces sp. DSM 44915]|uniref:Uncharacterized protein n=1 Tax=Streptomyces chisholmiae TaxID=3075540 RepID=A0ABU2JWY6_9ACTN|nr:hypothetical protein [Streptomyces sp. DSM 44915]MDT0269029.1 hypothetical protein [Streptomyces sp. DSM 44915]